MEPSEVIVRPERRDDHRTIRDVVAAAFGSSAEADLVDRIRASANYVPELALVALAGGEVVGHVMVSGATLRHASGERPVAMLSPLAVRPDRQGVGIGGRLVRTVLAAAADRGEPMVVLEGSPAYYSQLGFEPADRWGITMPLPDWAPPEAAQVVRFAGHDRQDPTLRGTVVYPSAFDGID